MNIKDDSGHDAAPAEKINSPALDRAAAHLDDVAAALAEMRRSIAQLEHLTALVEARQLFGRSDMIN